MDLTRRHLKELQRQFTIQDDGASSSLSNSRIDFLLLHQDEIMVNEGSDEIRSEAETEIINSSLENLEFIDDSNEDHREATSRSCLSINDTQLKEAPVKIHYDNELSKIFDPNNTSLLYTGKAKMECDLIVESKPGALNLIDTNTISPAELSKPNRSKLPLGQAVKPKRVGRGGILNAPGLHNFSSVKQKGSKLPLNKSLSSKSPSDLNFPIIDSLILMRAKNRS